MGIPKPIVVIAFAHLCFAISLAADRSVTVLAAASLKESIEEIARGYEQAHPGRKVLLSFAGSQQLATQLVLGARADVFASADSAQMDRVVAEGRVARAGVQCLARNKLAIAVAKSASRRVLTLKNLGDPGLKIVLARSQVPAGDYTRRMLTLLGQVFGRDWLARVHSNVASKELDVRTVLTKVELGEADAGVVYVTDIRAANGRVSGISIPNKFNVIASYQLAPMIGSADGAEFVKWARSPTGRQALSRRGFLLPSP